ncbi:RING finger protein 141-like [Bradysia coprophila]|uniref:RING finger protein 141-like n=1 Tax=Bradysia coprophila TaxID=38358 RepID=UPI00187D8650|nr:RING finger protein 141-like [Bradysia coprophila]
MGQSNSISEAIPETVEQLNYEVKKHAQIFSEIGTLNYDDFQKCLSELNELSRKCLDSSGKQLVFAVKKGTDATMLWKATVQIACVKVDPESRQIESYKFLNLKQFLRVFKTFQSHLQVMISSEKQQENLTASILMDKVDCFAESSPTSEEASGSELLQECSICLDRKPEVLLPCAHTFCCPCIEQWNMSRKTCPICQAELSSTDDTWVLSELPAAGEISEKICNELMALSRTEQ